VQTVTQKAERPQWYQNLEPYAHDLGRGGREAASMGEKERAKIGLLADER